MSEPESRNTPLQQALADLEKKKEEAANLASTKKSEFDEISKLQKRLDALSYEERRAVLNAAGLSHISAAPSPISPVRSSYIAPSRTPQAAMWRVWRFIPKCELWQAVCLTLDIEPNRERHDIISWLKQGKGVPKGLPNAFVERLQVVQANMSTNGPIRPLSLYQGVLTDLCAEVLLSEISALALHCGWQIPEAMNDLAGDGVHAHQEKGEVAGSKSIQSETATHRPVTAPTAALSEQTADERLTKREKQIRAIEAAAVAQGYAALSIPTGGKSLLRTQCQKSYPALFGAGPDPFDDAWAIAIACDPPRLRMAEHDKFAGK